MPLVKGTVATENHKLAMIFFFFFHEEGDEVAHLVERQTQDPKD